MVSNIDSLRSLENAIEALEIQTQRQKIAIVENLIDLKDKFSDLSSFGLGFSEGGNSNRIVKQATKWLTQSLVGSIIGKLFYGKRTNFILRGLGYALEWWLSGYINKNPFVVLDKGKAAGKWVMDFIKKQTSKK